MNFVLKVCKFLLFREKEYWKTQSWRRRSTRRFIHAYTPLQYSYQHHTQSIHRLSLWNGYVHRGF